MTEVWVTSLLLQLSVLLTDLPTIVDVTNKKIKMKIKQKSENNDRKPF
jgi:hypothetical protein